MHITMIAMYLSIWLITFGSLYYSRVTASVGTSVLHDVTIAYDAPFGFLIFMSTIAYVKQLTLIFILNVKLAELRCHIKIFNYDQ
jgi:hypothetical protein